MSLKILRTREKRDYITAGIYETKDVFLNIIIESSQGNHYYD